MKNLTKGVALAAITLVSTNSFAEGDNGFFFGKDAPGKWVIGVKAAKLDTNLELTEEADASGVVLGYEFAKAVGEGTSAIEIEYLSGDTADIDQNLRYDADMLNVFFTYRSPGTIFYKIKGGVAYSDVIINRGFVEERDFSDVGLAVGVGLGVRIQEYGQIEVEYSKDSGSTDLAVYGINALLEF